VPRQSTGIEQLNIETANCYVCLFSATLTTETKTNNHNQINKQAAKLSGYLPSLGNGSNSLTLPSFKYDYFNLLHHGRLLDQDENFG
jgi:hypothetical protein